MIVESSFDEQLLSSYYIYKTIIGTNGIQTLITPILNYRGLKTRP